MATFGGNFMSDTLLEIRQKIDKIDQALLDLIRQRLSLSNEIATVKIAAKVRLKFLQILAKVSRK